MTAEAVSVFFHHRFMLAPRVRLAGTARRCVILGPAASRASAPRRGRSLQPRSVMYHGVRAAFESVS
jgi:hypothetical protein